MHAALLLLLLLLLHCFLRSPRPLGVALMLLLLLQTVVCDADRLPLYRCRSTARNSP